MRPEPRRRWAGRALAPLAGAVLACSLPGAGLWWLAWAGLVPLLVLLGRAHSYRDAAWRSWAAAAGFFLTAHHWLVPHLGVFAVPALAAAGLLWVPFGLGAHRVLRPPLSWAQAALGLLFLPCLWVTLEALRSWKHLGGSWAPLGLGQWRTPHVLDVAALGGVWLLSALVVAVNVGVAVVVLPGAHGRARLFGGSAALLFVAAATAHGALHTASPATGAVRVAGVQPGMVSDSLAAHLRLTDQLAPSTADVVVWGQSSVALDPSRRPDVAGGLRRAAESAGGHLLVNVDAQGAGGHITKSTHHYRPDGVAGIYRKQRLAPFGEYVPLRPLLGPLLGHTDAARVDRAPGDALTLLRVGDVQLGPLISYESTFPDLRRALAARGADVTVVQGSLTTFHGTWAQRQQASAEAVRAVESGRSTVLVNSSGTSAAFDADGRPLTWVPPTHRGTFTVTVPLHEGITPYVRWGDWFPVLATAVTAVTAALLFVARRPRNAAAGPQAVNARSRLPYAVSGLGAPPESRRPHGGGA